MCTLLSIHQAPPLPSSSQPSELLIVSVVTSLLSVLHLLLYTDPIGDIVPLCRETFHLHVLASTTKVCTDLLILSMDADFLDRGYLHLHSGRKISISRRLTTLSLVRTSGRKI